MVRVAAGLIAGLAALVMALVVIVAASRWVDFASGDLPIVLYLIFGQGQTYRALVAAGAAVVAAGLAFLIAAGAGASRRTELLGRSAALGVVVSLAVVVGACLGWGVTTPGWRGQVAGTRWWLTDTTPPVVTVSAPSEPVRGVAAITLSARDEGPHHVSRVAVDGMVVSVTESFALDTSNLSDGLHTVVVEAEDEARQRNRAQASATLRTETRWWMSDTTPPVITLTVPLTVAHGVVAIGLDTADAGEHHVTKFTLDDVALPITRLLSIDTAHLTDGEHTILVEAEDSSRQRNRAQVRAVLRSDNNPPAVSVRFDPSVATQGHAQFVYVQVNEPVTVISATLAGQPLALAWGSGYYWAVLGFDVDAQARSALLAVRAVDAVGNSTQITATQVMTQFVFPIEYYHGEGLGLSAELQTLLGYGPAETAYLDSVFAPVSPEQLWQGAFAAPLQGRQTSPFAIRRSYRGEPPESPHGGADSAADMGAPVPATNRGRVVLAETLKLRGNAVIIDHGMGVYSCFYHLSEIRVKKGQMVEKGQILGLVGSTGLSTGPHLHWEMRVSGKAIDPWPWTLRAFPSFP